MRYLGNNSNLVRTASLTGTNGLPSDAIFRTDTAPKSGGGRVSLQGPYEGAANTDVDIEIVDNGGGTIQVSQPVFNGVGSGAMSAVTVAGVDPQSVLVTLEDLGTETRSAYATFQGANLKARTPGTPGNLIAIDVDHSALVDSDTDWSLQEDLRQDTNEYSGDHWDFGAAPLEPSGAVPVSAPRLRFGNDPQVYRAYKVYKEGRYRYGFTPSPVRDVAKGARVHAVTGTRTITITNGTDVDTLPGIVTLYDALSAIRDDSALVLVDGAIVNDRMPGGQGIAELSVRTRSYVLGVTTTESGPIGRVELEVEALDGAPTETLSITCVDAAIPGQERWDVHGDVSGALARALTNAEYVDGRYRFTIPLPLVDPNATSGVITVEYLPEGTRSPEASLPAFCPILPRLGSHARDGTWDFVYVSRPPEACDCNDGDYEGAPNDDCLGVTPEEVGVSEASQLRRLQRLTAEVRKLLQVNTSPTQSFAPNNIPWIETSAAILRKCLAKLASGTLQFDAWTAAKDYAVDVVVEPSPRNGYRYAASVAGTSSGSAPTWPTTVGATVPDGSVTWECIGKTPYGMFDDVFEQWSSEAEILSLGSQSFVTTPAWEASHAYSGDAVVVRPTTRNGWTYVGSAGTSGGTEPTWPTTAGDFVVDGDITWYTLDNYWEASESLSVGATASPGNGRRYVVTTAGTTDVTEPNWPVAAPGFEFTDGTVTWQTKDGGIQDRPTADTFFERYRTMCSDVLASAGLDSDFDPASVNGDGCWQDREKDKWWASDGAEPPYMPLFTGFYNYSCKRGYDADGKPYIYSTHEFGFGIRIGCEDLLAIGDRLRVVISGTGGSNNGYQPGDGFQVRVNQANPLPLGGGQTGNDTLTWSVVCSIAGRLDDYALVTTSPVAYSASVDPSGTVGFLIAPGGIPFALGDQFRFDVEGGRFKWRRDGGAWSTLVDIADTDLVDGLAVAFTGGAAPSWVAPDRWSFRAEATYGVDQLRSPLDGEFEWSGSTTIDVAAGGPIAGIFIGGHAIPADAEIRLQGSDDDFATTPLDVAIAWRSDSIWQAVEANRSRYRVTVNRGGRARWLYLGPGTRMATPNGTNELGRLTKRVRLASPAKRRGLGARIEHSALPAESTDAMFALLDHAGVNDDRLLAIVPNDVEAECGMVRFDADSIEVDDLKAYQPRDPSLRWQSFALDLEAA